MLTKPPPLLYPIFIHGNVKITTFCFSFLGLSSQDFVPGPHQGTSVPTYADPLESSGIRARILRRRQILTVAGGAVP